MKRLEGRFFGLTRKKPKNLKPSKLLVIINLRKTLYRESIKEP